MAPMAACVDRPPAARLGLAPECRCDDDVERALCELAYLESRQKTVDAATKARVDLVLKEAEAELVTLVPTVSPAAGDSGKCAKADCVPVSFADRRMLLSAAVERYVRRHREALFAGGSKTRRFVHGSLSFRDQPLAVRFLGEATAKSVFDLIVDRARLKKVLFDKIDELLAGITFYGVPITVFVRFALNLNVSGIKDSYEKDELDNRRLEQLGLAVSRGEESFAIKLNEYRVDSESQKKR